MKPYDPWDDLLPETRMIVLAMRRLNKLDWSDMHSSPHFAAAKAADRELDVRLSGKPSPAQAAFAVSAWERAWEKVGKKPE